MLSRGAIALVLAAALALPALAHDRPGERSGQQLSAAQVRQVQEKLGQAGYDPGPIDGVMGSRTETALRNFQRDKGLNATGEIDEETLAALDITRGSATAGTRSR